MLNENIKAIRKSKGLSQQELAVKLNVVRQTVSKWEQGLSVPDSDMLIRKTGSDKPATGTKENHEKKNYSLAAYFIMCNYNNGFCGFNNME